MLPGCRPRSCAGAAFLVGLATAVVPTSLRGQESARAEKTAESDAAPASAATVLDFKVKDIDGRDRHLADYKGKVVLIVNVASQCGLTPQYAELQELHEKYGRQGLVILGFPANDFGRQEPGTNEEVKSFCTSRFGVTFDMFAKVCVKGEECCDLYKYLTGKETNPRFAGDIRWNFTKFLVGRDGQVIARFEPPVKPSSKEVTEAVEKALAGSSGA